MSTCTLSMHQERATVLLPLLPTFVGAYFAARLAVCFLFFQSDPRFGAGVATSLNLFLFVIAVFYTFGPKVVSFRSMLQLHSVRCAMAFLCVSFISLLWSETVSIPVALAYWMGMAADTAMVVLFLRISREGAEELALMRGYVLGAALVATLAWLFSVHAGFAPG